MPSVISSLIVYPLVFMGCSLLKALFAGEDSRQRAQAKGRFAGGETALERRCVKSEGADQPATAWASGAALNSLRT